MSFKIPCGGFKLDEKLFSLDKNDVLSIPKPLTYDYMPEGYPSKSVGTVTLMEEQEVAFSDSNGLMAANSPVALDIKLGDKLTVVWDGVSYDVVVKKAMAGSNEILAFGNLGLTGSGETTDHPFICGYAGQDQVKTRWITADTATSHTIGVMRQQETITPMSTDFIPKNFNVVFSGGSTSSIPTSCNVTYDELRGWIENGTPVFAIYKIEDNNGSVVNVINIMQFLPNTDSLSVYYQTRGSTDYFKYNSDGTISGSGVES